jgi:hypothetical protein
MRGLSVPVRLMRVYSQQMGIPTTGARAEGIHEPFGQRVRAGLHLFRRAPLPSRLYE